MGTNELLFQSFVDLVHHLFQRYLLPNVESKKLRKARPHFPIPVKPFILLWDSGCLRDVNHSGVDPITEQPRGLAKDMEYVPQVGDVLHTGLVDDVKVVCILALQMML